jgi:hypothetical protein
VTLLLCLRGNPSRPPPHAGGPGKGMHSRLYTRVLNQHPWMHNCTALNSIYNSTGLVGIFASAESSQAGAMVDVLSQEMQVGAAGQGQPPSLLRLRDMPTHAVCCRGRQFLARRQSTPTATLLNPPPTPHPPTQPCPPRRWRGTCPRLSWSAPRRRR